MTYRRPGRLLVLITVLAVLAITATLCLSRTWLAFGTETDFFMTYVPEASRILAGEAPLVAYHPPLYPALLAGVESAFRDWEATGLALSAVSSLVLLFAAFSLFTRLGGHYAGWGAVLGLLVSPTHLTFSAVATSDMPFAALYAVGLLLAVRAMDRDSLAGWLLFGLVGGLVALTRTNGFVLAALALLSWWGRGTRRARATRFSAAILGLLAAPVGWALIARAWGAPFAPSSAIDSMAMAFYTADGSERISWDALDAVRGRFGGVYELVAHDPLRVARMYFGQLAGSVLPRALVTGLLAPWIALLSLPGVYLLWMRGKRPAARAILLLAAAHLLLVNLKTFEIRFYLFLVPILGAGLGLSFHALTAPSRRWVFRGAVLLLLAGVVFSPLRAYRKLHTRFEEELDVSVPAARSVVPEGSPVIARKPQVAFYTSGPHVYLPNVESVAEFEEWWREAQFEGEVFLYFGRYERKRRPGLAALRDAGNAPAWLVPVLEDEEWVLYRVDGP